MPLSDSITVTTRYAEPPLGVPSLQIPICAFLPTSDQRTAWVAAYGSTETPNVVQIDGGSWQGVLEDLGVTTGEDIQVALTDLFSQKLNGAPMQPGTVLLALRAVPVAQVYTATVAVVAAAGTYTTTINGTDFVVAYTASANATATATRCRRPPWRRPVLPLPRVQPLAPPPGTTWRSRPWWRSRSRGVRMRLGRGGPGVTLG